MKLRALIAATTLALTGVALLPPPPAHAAVITSESFDTVLPDGWSMGSNSTPLFADNAPVFPGSGAGFFGAEDGSSGEFAAMDSATLSDAGTIDDWLISPMYSSLSNGDTWSFYTRSEGVVPDQLEVRLSTNGSCAPSTGSFTTLLMTVNPGLAPGGYPTFWQKYTVTLTGITGNVSGCLAFRHYLPNASPDMGSFIGIDTYAYTDIPRLTVTTPATTNASCYGAADGAVTSSVSGGSGSYSYVWSPSGGTADRATGLAAGNYAVNVTDLSTGATGEAWTTVHQPAALAATIGSQHDPTTQGGSDGSATIDVSGGTPGYTYSWAPSGGTAATATGLSAGTYTVTVTDANACATTQQVTISDPPPPAPVVTTSGGSAAFVAGDNAVSPPVVVDGALTLSASTSTMESATVLISGNFHAGEDVLAFVNDSATMGDIAGSYNAATGTLTLSSGGTGASVAQWQAALRSVAFTNTAITPSTAARTVTFDVVDTYGTHGSPASRTVTVADTDQTPLISSSASGAQSYVLGGPAAAVDPTVSLTDLDNSTLSSAGVSVGTGFAPGDTLGFTNTASATFGNIVGSYDAVTGVLTLTSSGATATTAQWEAALRAVTFASTDGTGQRSVRLEVSDGTKSSSPLVRSVDVSMPVVAGDVAYRVTSGATLDVDPAHGVLSSTSAGVGLTASVAVAPAHGSVVLAADGSFTYTPVDGYVGADSFTYLVRASNGTSDQGTATITVRAPYVPPIVDPTPTPTPDPTPTPIPDPPPPTVPPTAPAPSVAKDHSHADGRHDVIQVRLAGGADVAGRRVVVKVSGRVVGTARVADDGRVRLRLRDATPHRATRYVLFLGGRRIAVITIR